jgi:hypothetical protein
MLWNLIGSALEHCGEKRPGGIFEDQPQHVREAWERAASLLQRRAKLLGRLA